MISSKTNKLATLWQGWPGFVPRYIPTHLNHRAVFFFIKKKT